MNSDLSVSMKTRVTSMCGFSLLRGGGSSVARPTAERVPFWGALPKKASVRFAHNILFV